MVRRRAANLHEGKHERIKHQSAPATHASATGPCGKDVRRWGPPMRPSTHRGQCLPQELEIGAEAQAERAVAQAMSTRACLHATFCARAARERRPQHKVGCPYLGPAGMAIGPSRRARSTRTSSYGWQAPAVRSTALPARPACLDCCAVGYIPRSRTPHEHGSPDRQGCGPHCLGPASHRMASG